MEGDELCYIAEMNTRIFETLFIHIHRHTCELVYNMIRCVSDTRTTQRERGSEREREYANNVQTIKLRAEE